MFVDFLFRRFDTCL